jgi:hypothetical protein
MHYHKDMYFFQDLYNDDDDDFGIGYSCVKRNHKLIIVKNQNFM